MRVEIAFSGQCSVHGGDGRKGLAVFLYLAEGVQAYNKRQKKEMASRDAAKVCSDAHRREIFTDGQERSEEVEQVPEARLHKYRRDEKFDSLILGAKGGMYTYGI